MPIVPTGQRSKLKENVLASRLEGVSNWMVQNRPRVLTIIGIVLAAILIGSVIVLRQKEQQELAWTRLAQAQSYASQNKTSEARQILTELLSSNTAGTFRLYLEYNLGEVALKEKNYDEAVQHYRAVIDRGGKEPLVPLAYSNLAFSFEEKKDFADSARVYQEFLDKFPDHFLAPRTQFYLGRAHLLAGEMEAGNRALGNLIDLYPTSEWAKNARQLLDKNKTP